MRRSRAKPMVVSHILSLFDHIHCDLIIDCTFSDLITLVLLLCDSINLILLLRD